MPREKKQATKAPKPMGRERRSSSNGSDDGVKRCIELMTSGQWVTGRSAPAIAEEFDVAVVTAEQWASSASRIVRLALEKDGARDDIKARMVATLDFIVSQAASDKMDRRTAVQAIAEQGKLLGLVTTKVDLSVRAYEDLTPEAMRTKLLEQREKIDLALAKLDAENPELASPQTFGEHVALVFPTGETL